MLSPESEVPKNEESNKVIAANLWQAKTTHYRDAVVAGVGKLGLFSVLLVFVVVLSVLSPVFLTWLNVTNVLLQSTILAMLALGETFVIMTGGIDLSVGGVLGISSAIGLGLMNNAHMPLAVGILVSLGIGAIFGLFNGIAVAKLGITPLIATLATMGIGEGLLLLYTNGTTIAPVPPLYAYLGTERIMGIPVMMIVVLLFIIIAWFILSRTVFGRSVFATGGNLLAARLSGIATGKIILLTYVLSGVLAGVAGILLSARLEAVGPTSGNGMELTVIAAVVIGGTSLFGGQGSIVGTILGVILLSLVSNAINLLSIPPAWDQTVEGGVIFLAALIDVYRRKLGGGKRKKE